MSTSVVETLLIKGPSLDSNARLASLNAPSKTSSLGQTPKGPCKGSSLPRNPSLDLGLPPPPRPINVPSGRSRFSHRYNLSGPWYDVDLNA